VRTGPCLLLALCLLSQGCARKDPAPKKGDFAGGGGVPITAATVTRKDVPVEIQVVGNVEAYRTISVKAQVGGELTHVYFREGDYVKKGEPLFTIDPRQLEAQLNQAQANLARDEAQLGLLQANLTRDKAQEKYAQAEVARYNSLLEHALISKEQADQVRTSAEAASAAVLADQAALQSARATVEATRANVENIKVQFGYTSIRSPLDGRTGNLNVKEGNVVAANSMDLMTINQVEPIYVTFSVPEARLPDIRKGQLVIVTSQTGTTPAESGEISFIDNAVDATTGTIKVKGTFANKGRQLWPGEFVRVTIRLSTQADALVVPNQSVQTGQEGSYVFVIKEDRTVEMRPVTTGTRVDQDLVIEKGLAAGEKVVMEGQLRLAPGMRVQVQSGSGGPPSGRPTKRGPGKRAESEP
jgi:multidrug efflux system membrane fusion protein